MFMFIFVINFYVSVEFQWKRKLEKTHPENRKKKNTFHVLFEILLLFFLQLTNNLLEQDFMI